jgi:hypothetical protein
MSAAAKVVKKSAFTAAYRVAGLNYLDALTVQTTALRKVRWGAMGSPRRRGRPGDAEARVLHSCCLLRAAGP